MNTYTAGHVDALSSSLNAQRRELCLSYLSAAADIARLHCTAVTDITFTLNKDGQYRTSDVGCIHEGSCLGGLHPDLESLGSFWFDPRWDLAFHGLDDDGQDLMLSLPRFILSQAQPELEEDLHDMARDVVAYYEGLTVPTYTEDEQRFFEPRHLPTLLAYAAKSAHEARKLRDGMFVFHNVETCDISLWEADHAGRWPVATYEAALGITQIS